MESISLPQSHLPPVESLYMGTPSHPLRLLLQEAGRGVLRTGAHAEHKVALWRACPPIFKLFLQSNLHLMPLTLVKGSLCGLRLPHSFLLLALCLALLCQPCRKSRLCQQLHPLTCLFVSCFPEHLLSFKRQDVRKGVYCHCTLLLDSGPPAVVQLQRGNQTAVQGVASEGHDRRTRCWVSYMLYIWLPCSLFALCSSKRQWGSIRIQQKPVWVPSEASFAGWSSRFWTLGTRR